MTKKELIKKILKYQAKSIICAPSYGWGIVQGITSGLLVANEKGLDAGKKEMETKLVNNLNTYVEKIGLPINFIQEGEVK